MIDCGIADDGGHPCHCRGALGVEAAGIAPDLQIGILQDVFDLVRGSSGGESRPAQPAPRQHVQRRERACIAA
ncbi:hypothetical protein XH88_05730 [Bradyrhizobium sp. CCBAU 51627]|nr:hypothetical protein [Bradyrhizobium sp. CCBAU 51627]